MLKTIKYSINGICFVSYQLIRIVKKSGLDPTEIVKEFDKIDMKLKRANKIGSARLRRLEHETKEKKEQLAYLRDFTLRMKQEQEKYGGIWGEHPVYTVQWWGYEASENNTRLGYWEWVVHQIEAEEKCSIN